MAKSGIQALLEALQQSGVDTRGVGGNGPAEGGPAAGGTGGAGGDNTIHVDFSQVLDNVKAPKSKGVLALIILLAIVVLVAAYWWFHPPISVNSTDTWTFAVVVALVIVVLIFLGSQTNRKSAPGEGGGMKVNTFKKLLIIPAAIVVAGVLGGLLSLAIIPGNAEKYSNILQTDTLEFAQDIQEVNYNEIPVIDRDSAILLGNREMGSIPEYVSQFEVSPLYSQINYQGTPVRVSPLAYADLFKWFTNREGGLPAYALVNMTTQDAEIVRLGDAPIHYSPSEPLVRNIDRHVQLKYPFYMFDEKSFEIDEEGHAWWICPVQKYTIGLFGGVTIDRVVLCDATTGECQDLAIDECPQWVDRVFPADLLIQQYNWYGAYNNGWLNSFLGQEGVVRTTPGSNGAPGYNYIAKDDDVWVYTGVTSATADNSIVGFVLVNQRTQESHFYSVSGATEDSAMSSAEGQVQNLRYVATFPLLINVANQPTYFMALKDGAGLVKKFAMVDIQRYQNVAVGDTVAETQKSYEALLATNGVDTSAGGALDTLTRTGVIRTMAQAVLDGNSHFYVTLENDNTIYDFALPGLLGIVSYRVGDTITFTYLEGTGTAPVYAFVGPDGEEVTASGEATDDTIGQPDEPVTETLTA